MKALEGIKILHINKIEELPSVLAHELDCDPNDLEFTFPQFDRTNGRTVNWIPKTKKEFDILKQMDEKTLKMLGLQKWTEEDELWLYPAEWYDSIPDGYEIVDINNVTENFKHGETDDDRRFGALAFGFKSNMNPPSPNIEEMRSE